MVSVLEIIKTGIHRPLGLELFHQVVKGHEFCASQLAELDVSGIGREIEYARPVRIAIPLAQPRQQMLISLYHFKWGRLSNLDILLS